MRLRKVKHAKELLSEDYPFVVSDPVSHSGKWKTLFPINNPIYLEIGCGKGKFITETAKRFPNLNFIAIERFASIFVRVVEKMLDDPLPNLLLINADAEHIDEMFGFGEIAGLYLNFSDPWPKRRQAKRRLSNPRFLDKYAELLVDDAVVKLKTDNFGFFRYSLMTFNDHQKFWIKKVNLDLAKSDINNVTTEFEERFTKMGNPIFYLEIVKKRSYI